MKLTQMIEKFAKQGMLNGVARAELLQAAEETERQGRRTGGKQKNGGSGKSHSGGRRQKREGDFGTAGSGGNQL